MVDQIMQCHLQPSTCNQRVVGMVNSFEVATTSLEIIEISSFTMDLEAFLMVRPIILVAIRLATRIMMIGGNDNTITSFQPSQSVVASMRCQIYNKSRHSARICNNKENFAYIARSIVETSKLVLGL